MTLKPTRRRNGQLMATVSVTHHVDADMLAAAAVMALWDDASDYGTANPKPVSAAAMEHAVRNTLAARGREGFEFWTERFSEEDDDELARSLAWAHEMVERNFPSMAPDLTPLDPAPALTHSDIKAGTTTVGQKTITDSDEVVSANKQEGQDKRAAIMAFLRGYAAQNGYSPTQAEVGEAIGVSDISARKHLKVLEREGHITIGRGRRMIRITDR